MVFLAQIDCASLPVIDPFWAATCTWEHHGGLIRLFADLMDNPFEPGLAVALTCDPAASVTPALALRSDPRAQRSGFSRTWTSRPSHSKS